MWAALPEINVKLYYLYLVPAQNGSESKGGTLPTLLCPSDETLNRSRVSNPYSQ